MTKAVVPDYKGSPHPPFKLLGAQGRNFIYFFITLITMAETLEKLRQENSISLSFFFVCVSSTATRRDLMISKTDGWVSLYRVLLRYI